MIINNSLKLEPIVEEKIFSVSEFLDFLNKILKPCRVIVQGEVGEKINDYRKRNGYIYFNLLDKNNTKLSCSAFENVIDSLGIELEPGLEIRAIGYPEMMKKWGELKFQVEKIELVGEGMLKKQAEILKKKLQSLGYFDEKFKKTVPRFCENIGLITSQYGRGAKKDFLTHLKNFGFHIFFYDTRVEGSWALPEIIEAIRYFNQNFPQLDALVIIRGGGDWESLQPFNSEEIVKAIRASKIPVITGIGHEDDKTLADLAADLRASTPTDAAKILNENWKLASIKIYEYEESFILASERLFKNLRENIIIFKDNLESQLEQKIKFSERNLQDLFTNLNYSFQGYFQKFLILEKDFQRNLLTIGRLIKDRELEIKNYLKDLTKNQTLWKKRVEDNLKKEEEKIFSSNPILKLKQGYSITYDESNKIIKDIADLKPSQEIKTKFYKGQIFSKIKTVKK